MAKRWRQGGWRRQACAAMVVAALGLAVAALPAGRANASCLRATDVWCDSDTGLAIAGYDPLAYFIDRVPREGLAHYELAIDGATWRFTGPANMAAFARDWQVYAPRFGGRDPLQLARGHATPGNPVEWLIEDGRLYLFASTKSRRDWTAADPETRARAEANWPRVVEATQ